MSQAASGKVSQPEWQVPKPVVEEPVLKVYNSLTKSKNVFIPLKGRQVDWYNCGPTVYDSAHMGHARNYLTQDIVRRILRDYFAYDVNFVQNVTDLDDKIIVRGREQHLLQAYRDAHQDLSASLKDDIMSAFAAYYQSKLAKSLKDADAQQENESESHAFERLAQKDQCDAAWAKEMREKDEKFGLILGSLQSAQAGLNEAKSADEAISKAKDVLSWWLDKKDGHTVTDPAIFRALAAHWEDSFNSDMQKLRILPPDTVTRVSEYVPEIVSFVEKIIDNGFAYVQEGNVWFDVGAFEGAKSGKGKEKEQEESFEHVYAKLAPWNKGNRELLEEGEGALTTGRTKRSASDFALWKSCKPGEPTWPSPWGPGRPGWHIECSVMASEILGQRMDIHSGGIDLVFPHHDNEIAQSEAYHDCRQWVNYFLHTGHLHIQGLKMSKSLKNFITIEEALKTWSARQLRLAFMMQTWSAKMDLTEGTRTGMESIEETFNNFFRTVKAKLSDFDASLVPSDGHHHLENPEKGLLADLHKAQHSLRIALCDSFNTPDALNILMELVSNANVYLQGRPRPKNIEPIKSVAQWLTRILRIFGLGEGAAVNQDGAVGWGDAPKAGQEVDSAIDREAVLMPYLRTLSTFRDDLLKLALGGATGKDFLELCDRLRDNELVDLGVALDDQEDGKALVKLAPAEDLRRARDEKKAAIEVKAARKAAAAAAEETKRLAKLEKSKIPPIEMFRPPHVEQGLYTAWDENGLPTKDDKGEDITKGKSKKLKKEWDAQVKAHNEWKQIVDTGDKVIGEL